VHFHARSLFPASRIVKRWGMLVVGCIWASAEEVALFQIPVSLELTLSLWCGEKTSIDYAAASEARQTCDNEASGPR